MRKAGQCRLPVIAHIDIYFCLMKPASSPDHHNGIPGTGFDARAAGGALERRCIRIRCCNYPVRTGIHARHALGAFFFIDSIDAVFIGPDGLHRTDLGAFPALVAKVDAIIPRCGKPPFDPQRGQGRPNLPVVFHGAGQAAGATAGAVFVNGFQFQNSPPGNLRHGRAWNTSTGRGRFDRCKSASERVFHDRAGEHELRQVVLPHGL